MLPPVVRNSDSSEIAGLHELLSQQNTLCCHWPEHGHKTWKSTESAEDDIPLNAAQLYTVHDMDSCDSIWKHGPKEELPTWCGGGMQDPFPAHQAWKKLDQKAQVVL